MRIYALRRPEVPWGDYGSILVHGMTRYRGREADFLQLERTGPFVPPITQPGIGNVLVTDTFRQSLERSGLRGLSFRPVQLRRIVRLAWETWDPHVAEPAQYPARGEPESYILGRRHDPALAQEIGPIWELAVGVTSRVTREGEWPHTIIRVARSTLTPADLFRADGVAFLYVSERAKD